MAVVILAAAPGRQACGTPLSSVEVAPAEMRAFCFRGVAVLRAVDFCRAAHPPLLLAALAGLRRIGAFTPVFGPLCGEGNGGVLALGHGRRPTSPRDGRVVEPA
jgi:hypothetical protein